MVGESKKAASFLYPPLILVRGLGLLFYVIQGYKLWKTNGGKAVCFECELTW